MDTKVKLVIAGGAAAVLIPAALAIASIVTVVQAIALSVFSILFAVDLIFLKNFSPPSKDITESIKKYILIDVSISLIAKVLTIPLFIFGFITLTNAIWISLLVTSLSVNGAIVIGIANDKA